MGLPIANEDPLDVEPLLENWARWSRLQVHRGHCLSLEHKYRQSKSFHPEQPRTAVDVQKALAVERAICGIPTAHQRALVFHYHHFAPSSFICRKLALHHRAWQQFITDARRMLAHSLLSAGVDARAALR